MTPVGARLKPGVIAAIGAIGTIEKAAAQVERKKSWVGEWNTLHGPAFPPVDAAVALDAVSVAKGDLPPITRLMAAENGFVLVRESTAEGEGDLTDHWCAVTREASDVMTALVEADRNGLDPKRRAVAINEARQLQEAAASLVALLESGR